MTPEFFFKCHGFIFVISMSSLLFNYGDLRTINQRIFVREGKIA